MILLENYHFSEPKKRSISLAGHTTSFTLEDSFWFLLKSYAHYHSISVASVVLKLDTIRSTKNSIGLSSLIRQFIINDIQENPHHYK